MVSSLLIYVGAAAVAFWGGMHIAKTQPVIAGFEPLSDNNRYVLKMEWLVEGVALIFAAVLLVSTTLLLGPETAGSRLVYGASIGFLLTMTVVSLFTRARASVLSYKLCAPIFMGAAVLIFIGGFAL